MHHVIDNQLRPDNIQIQSQLYQSTGHPAPAYLIVVCEEVFLRVLRFVAALDKVVLNDEVDDADVIPHHESFYDYKIQHCPFFWG